MQIFLVSLPLYKLLIAPLSKSCALTARTYVAEKDMTIPNLSERLRLLRTKSKKEESDRRDLNISDRRENLIPCSIIYLEMRARLLTITGITGNSSIG